MQTIEIPSDLRSDEFYFNRELSLIEFQRRVLMEAEADHPLLESLKFLAIFSSNLDEFFMIRVAGLKSQVLAGVNELSYDGKTPKKQLEEIRRLLKPLFEKQAEILTQKIMPELEKHNIVIHHYSTLTKRDRLAFKNYFLDHIFPVLTPLSLGPAHPFPRLVERGLNIAFVISEKSKKEEERRIAFLQIPKSLPRFLELDRKTGYHYVLIEQVIIDNSDVLFPGLKIETAHTFRVTRDADIEIAEDEAEDLLSEIEEMVKSRRWGRAAVRLEVSQTMPDYLVGLLREYLYLENSDIYVQNRPLNLIDYFKLVKLDIPRLKDKQFVSNIPAELRNDNQSIFDILKKQDVFLHHPFDSFSNSTLKLISQASTDKDVVAIKIVLYRTGGNSPIIAALIKAAENGKSVTAFVELKARFDEENNIIWARELEAAGIHVVYGVLGFKTHCKICMVVRRENASLRTYMHLSTGNYNHITARLYTDMSILTAREEFALDAVNLFNSLTGYSHYQNWQQFVVAPSILLKSTIEMINKEVELHTDENPGLIIVKMNSLAHMGVIQALYKASQRGVKIKLMIRGICCLKPGVEGLSDNIEVRSVVGRFLEHSRIIYFKSAGKDKLYLSSADWMTRNLEKRYELQFPINDKKMKKEIMDILDIYWKDSSKSWLLSSDGSYMKLDNSTKKFNAQEYFLTKTRRRNIKFK